MAAAVIWPSNLPEIIRVCLDTRRWKAGTWYCHEAFPEVARQIAADIWREMPPPHFRGEFIDLIQQKVRGFEMLSSQPPILLLTHRVEGLATPPHT